MQCFYSRKDFRRIFISNNYLYNQFNCCFTNMHQRFTAQHWGTSSEKKKKRRRRRSLKWTDELISIGNCQQYFRIFFLFFVFCFFYQRSPQSYSPGPVVQRVDNAIHFINFYPANKELLFAILIRWGVLSNVWKTGARLPLCMQGTYVASVRTLSRSLSWWPVKGN